MEALAAQLDRLDEALSLAVGEALDGNALAGCDDAELLRVLATASRLGRLVDAALVEATGHVHERCLTAERVDRLSTRMGCRDTNELLRRATRCSAQRASELVRAADAVHRRTALSSGELLTADYPSLREALGAGEVSSEALGGIVRALDKALPAATVAQRLAADTELAAAASGTAPDQAPPAGADDLRWQAQVWAMVLDQDGAEPREDRAQRLREIRVGRVRDGLASVRGYLLADVAAQLTLLTDAIDNPKRQPSFGPAADDDDPPERLADTRTAGQRRHDAFAAILTAAAGCADMPTLGGAAPTLTVVVRAEDLVAGVGFAHIDGIDEPVPLEVARHVGCCGKIERITCDSFGRILDIQVQDRIFTPQQRRAIATRDGGCVIPGCRIKAVCCEIHHAQEWAEGGPTSTDNGVTLCWFHHRTLGSSGWEVRIRDGVPEVRGPSWWDPHRRWRRAAKHPLWMRPRARTG
ncbi:HNH endonuclease signature motif containing protein [Microbacterium kribbense]|uniref:HNH endonuclease signature motif containing protein n=1 Tax=Microbacterium kribbense TaxID=433645 RepID=A0ABP7GRA5_9MICO